MADKQGFDWTATRARLGAVVISGEVVGEGEARRRVNEWFQGQPLSALDALKDRVEKLERQVFDASDDEYVRGAVRLVLGGNDYMEHALSCGYPDDACDCGQAPAGSLAVEDNDDIDDDGHDRHGPRHGCGPNCMDDEVARMAAWLYCGIDLVHASDARNMLEGKGWWSLDANNQVNLVNCAVAWVNWARAGADWARAGVDGNYPARCGLEMWTQDDRGTTAKVARWIAGVGDGGGDDTPPAGSGALSGLSGGAGRHDEGRHASGDACDWCDSLGREDIQDESTGADRAPADAVDIDAAAVDVVRRLYDSLGEVGDGKPARRFNDYMLTAWSEWVDEHGGIVVGLLDAAYRLIYNALLPDNQVRLRKDGNPDWQSVQAHMERLGRDASRALLRMAIDYADDYAVEARRRLAARS